MSPKAIPVSCVVHLVLAKARRAVETFDLYELLSPATESTSGELPGLRAAGLDVFGRCLRPTIVDTRASAMQNSTGAGWV